MEQVTVLGLGAFSAVGEDEHGYVKPGGVRRGGSVGHDDFHLLPCLFVGVEHRGQRVTYALVRSAVDLARVEGAVAIEGWPLAGSARPSSDAFVGREKVYEALGFSCVQRPSPQRAIMRLAFTET